MNISEFCIRRPVFTILLMAAVVVGGISGYKTLAISALPRVDFPTISVSATLSGASPETMASSVATPLENAFSTIAGITSMTSSSILGSSQIILQFDLDRNIDGAALDVQTAISSSLRSLPKEMIIPPSFRKVNPADQPVIFITVSSDTLPISQVDEYADTVISRRLSTLPGVAQVSIYGEQKYAVRVQVDPGKLSTQNLSFNDIQKVLSASLSNSPTGIISGAKQLFNIQVIGQPGNADKFKELITTWKNGAPIRLKDIAKVTDDVADDRSAAFIDGRRSVTLAIQRQPDANTIEVVQSILDLMPKLRSQIPAAIELVPLFDRSVSIRNSVRDVQFTLILTISLVITIIYLFLHNWRATFIPALSVPLSIIATYGGMALFGFSINNISLLAITLCVGFIVDDAIVMLENIMRHIEDGMSKFEAALKGSKEIGFTIISITFSLIAVFIPVLFMGGIIGRVFREFAVTISFAILVSGLVSLTLTPMLCSRLIKVQKNNQKNKLGNQLENIFNKMLAGYEKSLRWCLQRQFLMLMITISTLIISIIAFIMAPKGFFPLEDTGFISGQIETAQDISYLAMLEKQKQVAEIIKKNPAVKNVFFAVGGSYSAMNYGRLSISLKPRSNRVPVFEVINQLRKEVVKIEGVSIFLQPVQNMQIGGRAAKSLYQYTLQSNNLNELYQWSDKLLQALSGEKEFQDVTSDLQLKSLQALISVDQQKAASLGISYDDIKQVLYGAFGNSIAATIYTPSNNYSVIMEVDSKDQQIPEDIKKLYLRSSTNPGNKVVPLESMINITRSMGPLSVNHQGQLPAVTISFNLQKGASLGNAVTKLEEIKNNIQLPKSIIGSFQGSAQVFQDSNKGQGMLVLLSLIVIYIILGMLYESFIHPVTILSGLPSAAIGAILSLMIFHMDFDVISLVGIVMLIGIVKKNAIMMIDFAIHARREGKSAHDAIYQACLLRFRPIMMTSMSAIFGSLPIAFAIGEGSELRQPLGIAVVGGLIVSQSLTLYITPIIYLYMERFASRKEVASKSSPQ